MFAQFPVRQALLDESAKKIIEKIKMQLQTRLLIYPEIALQFIVARMQSFTYAKAQSLHHRVAQIHGPMVAQLLDFVSFDYGLYSLYGSISREPVQSRIQYIFIESRPCTASDLLGIVRSTLMTESYSALGRSESALQLTKIPAFVLNISCKPCTSCTANADDQEIKRLLVLVCVRFLRKYGLISDAQMQVALASVESSSGAKRPLKYDSDNAMDGEFKRRNKNYTVTNSRLQVIGQADNKYIMCQQDGWLVAIDQHAADERIRLENLFDDYSATLRRILGVAYTKSSIADIEGISVLMPPVQVRLSDHDWNKVSSVNAKLKQLGIQLAAQTLPTADDPRMCLQLNGLSVMQR
ncbi:hypothetical protein IWW36_002154 [Coemansia brasiliensis]|uniref:MutL C-terminal dimerisation domain-containing protein n=1 Tax=Coemansia brasiliensis TaxID=2650707 RepID=A0A9W8M057_9FUNG|nr:hypothetical protein IWW36_002154 [Coemansia brasiliensis]